MSTVNLGTWNTKLIYPLLMGFFSFLTLLSYKSRLHSICAYCIDKNFFFLAMLVVFISKIKEKVIK